MLRYFHKKRKKVERPAWHINLMFFIILIFMTIAPGVSDIAFGQDSPSWYRIRTNSVPYQPSKVIADTKGGLWVTAQDNTEYEPSLWYMSSGQPGDAFEFITNNVRNNYLSSAYLNISIKPQLSNTILYAVRDGMENTWYSMNNREVLCEKADGTWLTFAMQDTSYLDMGGDSSGVDSAHKIRVITGVGGTTAGILLIAARGIKYIDSKLKVSQSREVSTSYNNDFINDAFIDSRGRFWIASNRGLEQGSSLINTEYVKSKYPDNSSVPGYGGEAPVTGISEDSLGNMWFCSNSYGTDGVYCYTTKGAWVKYDLTALVSGINNSVTAMAPGSDGKMWFGPTGSGLVLYEPGGAVHWKQFTSISMGLKSENIISLTMAHDKLWLVTDYNPGVEGNGTGVHCLTFTQDGTPSLAATYTYRKNSTSLTSNRFNFIAADKSGGVWFPAYDDPSIARLKPDGTWQQFRGTIAGQSLGSYGIVGVAVDSKNKVYFAPLNSPPVAYDVTLDKAVTLPKLSYTDYYYYSLYIDRNDGKWFCGAFGVYYLNADNTAWTHYANPEIPEFADNYVDNVRVDDAGNAWFMTRTGITLMKKIQGGADQWLLFQAGDNSLYSGGYRIYIDDKGGVWNAAKQKFDSTDNTWQTVTDTSDFDHRHLRFTNGMIPADMDLSGALPWVTSTDQNRMTLDIRGNIYFDYGMVWLTSVNAGIVVCTPIKGDINRDRKLNMADAILAPSILTGTPPKEQSYAVDSNGNGKIDGADFEYILQKLAGMKPTAE